MQHIQAIPIRINTVITTHKITHENKHVNNNATCKFITQLALILVIITNCVKTFHEPPMGVCMLMDD
jgi:hypothetical protein